MVNPCGLYMQLSTVSFIILELCKHEDFTLCCSSLSINEEWRDRRCAYLAIFLKSLLTARGFRFFKSQLSAWAFRFFKFQLFRHGLSAWMEVKIMTNKETH